VGAPVASGDLIQFTFTGELYKAEGDIPTPWDGVAPGSLFEVQYVFDSEAVDQSIPDDKGRYDILEYRVTIDDASLWAANPWIEVWVWEDLYFGKGRDLPVDAGAGILLQGLGDVFQDDSLPLDLDLADFKSPPSFEVVQNLSQWEIRGNVRAFSREIVPAPPALALIAGAFCTGLNSRRREHQ
jgi:hypothetical protein